VTIVLDDFGTGYSSLSYLNRFHFDKIKIDRSFVERLDVDAGSAALISAMTSIAQAFGAHITAEGVETEKQCQMLRAAAVTLLQGYLFGAPRPACGWEFCGSTLSQRAIGQVDTAAA
jgi:EAL domain-containing protein (putative c-di-GMP-specific phosphodiesterase class I)